MFLLLSINPVDIGPKYGPAIDSAKTASYKQSGLETDVNNFKNISGKKATKWVKDNGFAGLVAAGAFIVPVVTKRELELHSHNFIFKGSANKKQLTWSIQF